MKVRTIPAADSDARRASDRLEGEQRGFGARFTSEMRKAITQIRKSPRLCSRTEDGPDDPENREYFIGLFNYRVIFAIWKGEAVIVAVIHAARPPGLWVPRLEDVIAE